MREWIALGQREQLTYRELSKRCGVDVRTLFRWVVRFREERALRARPDRADAAFVDLEENAAAPRSRIEIVLPDARRVVVQGAAIAEALTHAIAALKQC
jgi:transposase-like protein